MSDAKKVVPKKKHLPVTEPKGSSSCPTLHKVGMYITMLSLPLI